MAVIAVAVTRTRSDKQVGNSYLNKIRLSKTRESYFIAKLSHKFKERPTFGTPLVSASTAGKLDGSTGSF